MFHTEDGNKFTPYFKRVLGEKFEIHLSRHSHNNPAVIVGVSLVGGYQEDLSFDASLIDELIAQLQASKSELAGGEGAFL